MNLKTTLCWWCVNSVPTEEHGCSWSREFVPIDGWRATKEIRKYDVKEIETYTVHWCPQYIREERRIEYLGGTYQGDNGTDAGVSSGSEM